MPLFFLIAFALLLPRADQLEHQTQAIPSLMVTDISLIMAAAMGTSLEILAVLFRTMVGARLVPLTGKALEQKRFWVNWIYMPIHDMRRCCWRRTPRTWVGCIAWTTSLTRAQCLITGSSRFLSHSVRYEPFTTHKDTSLFCSSLDIANRMLLSVSVLSPTSPIFS